MLRGFQFLSAKPLLLVINLDEADTALLADGARAAESAGLAEFLSRAATRAVAVCAKIELEIAQLEEADAAAFLSDLGLDEPGVNRVIRATYDLLGYISFLTAGEDECRAWSIPRGTPAQLAAGEIHSDIARGFIRAEVVRFDAPHRARLDRGVPRARRGAARRQGVRRAGRRRHQLPVRHVREGRERSHCARVRRAGAARARRRGDPRQRARLAAARARLRERAGRACPSSGTRRRRSSRTPPPGAAST